MCRCKSENRCKVLNCVKKSQFGALTNCDLTNLDVLTNTKVFFNFRNLKKNLGVCAGFYSCSFVCRKYEAVGAFILSEEG